MSKGIIKHFFSEYHFSKQTLVTSSELIKVGWDCKRKSNKPLGRCAGDIFKKNSMKAFSYWYFKEQIYDFMVLKFWKCD